MVDGPAWADLSPARPRLDLNRATPGELARVARISWRLAARIVAARDAFEAQDSGMARPALDATGSRDIPQTPATPESEPPAVTPVEE